MHGSLKHCGALKKLLQSQRNSDISENYKQYVARPLTASLSPTDRHLSNADVTNLQFLRSVLTVKICFVEFCPLSFTVLVQDSRLSFKLCSVCEMTEVVCQRERASE